MMKFVLHQVLISQVFLSKDFALEFTEFLNDASYATAEVLNETLKFYRYDGLSAGIQCDAVLDKELVIDCGTYLYNGNLYLTGDIQKEHLRYLQEH